MRHGLYLHPKKIWMHACSLYGVPLKFLFAQKFWQVPSVLPCLEFINPDFRLHRYSTCCITNYLIKGQVRRLTRQGTSLTIVTIPHTLRDDKSFLLVLYVAIKVGLYHTLEDWRLDCWRLERFSSIQIPASSFQSSACSL
ncbi:MAG: hypothetical protein G01um101472_158 [Parcubacteria group bacterium Gr01-1014_72]|nr:MAG: hypothetical protein G01um101472_158 [Parcubacteria group bacterium Gr01-1014_72]